MYSQIDNFMENKLSALLTGFRKNHGTQHCLESMIENWKNTQIKGGFVAAIFMWQYSSQGLTDFKRRTQLY